MHDDVDNGTPSSGRKHETEVTSIQEDNDEPLDLNTKVRFYINFVAQLKKNVEFMVRPNLDSFYYFMLSNFVRL